MWQPLLAAAKVRGDLGEDLSQRFPYQPFLVRDRSVNAFALPGGYMGVHLGLMAITQTRDELASVLAHEMTHINQRHIARGFANSRQQSLISIAATILGVIAATQSGGGDAAGALITSGQAVGIQGQLNFSRDMEREADRIGSSVMASAGFDAAGMASMFERLQKASRLNDSGNFPYLRSHPLTTERIGEARARLEAGEAVAPGAARRGAGLGIDRDAARAHRRAGACPRADGPARRGAAALAARSTSRARLGDATRAEQFADAYSAALGIQPAARLVTRRCVDQEGAGPRAGRSRRRSRSSTCRHGGCRSGSPAPCVRCCCWPPNRNCSVAMRCGRRPPWPG